MNIAVETTINKESPKVPVKLELGNLYILWHRRGTDPRPAQLNFCHEGTMNSAIQAGRKFCDLTGTRFVRVSKFITDLDQALETYNKNGIF